MQNQLILMCKTVSHFIVAFNHLLNGGSKMTEEPAELVVEAFCKQRQREQMGLTLRADHQRRKTYVAPVSVLLEHAVPVRAQRAQRTTNIKLFKVCCVDL